MAIVASHLGDVCVAVLVHPRSLPDFRRSAVKRGRDCLYTLSSPPEEESDHRQGCQMAKFDPLFSLDCTRVEDVGAPR